MRKNIQYFQEYLNFLNQNDLYPKIQEVTGPSYTPLINIKGEQFLSFCSNNYLGLAGNEEVKKIVKENIDKYGVGSGSTRLLSGSLDIQFELEKKLSDFFNFDDSITFSSGYLANVGVIKMLIEPFPYFQLFGEKGGVILSDELNHASIIDGVRLAKVERPVYSHSDMESLEGLLKEHKGKRILIITDGVFSMDGDLANLKDITRLAKEYDALVMVDDSHAVGVLGPNGEGTAHHFGVEKDVDILMGSFTKAFGSIGGFISTNKTVADYLRITARSYIFSDPIIPAVVAGLIKTIEIIKNGKNIREKAIRNGNLLRAGLKGLGFDVLGNDTTIVPLLIGNEKKAIHFSNELLERKILAPCIRRPAVIEGKERIRFSVMASHSAEDVNKLLTICNDIGKSLKMI